MIKEEQLQPLGRFQRTHGLKGELNALFELESDFLAEGYPIVIDIDGIFVPFYAESVRPKAANTDLVKLEGVDSEEEAKEMVNKEIYGLKTDVAEFLGCDEDDVTTTADIIGFTVCDAKAGEIGVVDDIDDSTMNTLLIVSSAVNPDEKIYIPFVEDFIDEIDIESRTVYVRIPSELLNLNTKVRDDESSDFDD